MWQYENFRHLLGPEAQLATDAFTREAFRESAAAATERWSRPATPVEEADFSDTASIASESSCYEDFPDLRDRLEFIRSNREAERRPGTNDDGVSYLSDEANERGFHDPARSTFTVDDNYRLTSEAYATLPAESRAFLAAPQRLLDNHLAAKYGPAAPSSDTAEAAAAVSPARGTADTSALVSRDTSDSAASTVAGLASLRQQSTNGSSSSPSPQPAVAGSPAVRTMPTPPPAGPASAVGRSATR